MNITYAEINSPAKIGVPVKCAELWSGFALTFQELLFLSAFIVETISDAMILFRYDSLGPSVM